MPSFGLGIFCWWRYRARTATTTTAACGRNREELLGQRSDFSRPRQGAEEKSANATRKAVRSTASNQPSGLLLSPRWPTYRNVCQERCRPFGLGIFCWWRYRARTAATTTAACGRNREELLGQCSDFSRPRQGAEEKSANATRKAVRSTASNQPSGLLLSPRWPTYRNVCQERCC